MNFDLLILGGGLSGLTAAARSAELGCGTIGVFEKGPRLGGNGRVCQSFFASDFSDFGDPATQDNAKKLYAQVLRQLCYTGNPELLWRYLSHTAAVAAWLEGRGLSQRWRPIDAPGFTTGCSRNVETDPKRVVNAAPLGSVICQNLIEDIGIRENVSVYMNAPARRLLSDKQGAVRGAEILLNGKPVEVTGRRVILACGGAGGTIDALEQHLSAVFRPGDQLRLSSCATCTGDGIAMVGTLGGEIHRQMSMDLLEVGFLGGEQGSLGQVALHPAALTLDRTGRRVINEEHLNQVQCVADRSPGRTLYSLLGSGSMQAVWDRVGNGPMLSDFPIAFQKHLETGTLCIAEDAAQAAAYIGCGLGDLQRTLDRYGAACAAGQDDHLFKKARYLLPLGGPPYYIFQLGRGLNTTQGGITVTESLQPLRPDGSVIGGLYAVGDHVSGFVSDVFSGPLGTGMTFALVSGYLAAQDCAAELGS